MEMKKAIDKKRLKFYAWGGLAYLLLWLIADLQSFPGTFFIRVINNIWLAIYIVGINFILYEYALVFLRKKGRNILLTFLFSVIAGCAVLLLFSFGLFAWRWIGIQPHIYTSLKAFTSLEEGVFYIFPHGLLSVFFFGIIKNRYEYIKLKATTQQLRIEKQAAELNFLRSQTNPHFLFNTLNNIYSLARDKSDLAPESILRLSQLLRFMLYETGSNYIAVEQELKIINDYIALEKLRYDDSLLVNFKYTIDNMKQPLPPLLLIPLVENAFKHGASETRGQSFINIDLTIHKQELIFNIKNSTENVQEEKMIKENIGLSNLRSQLKLLYTDYHLIVEQEELVFVAILKINLTSHV
jgi:two-component system LytT family sensor kinase